MSSSRKPASKIKSLAAFLRDRVRLKKSKKKIVFTNGVFDVLHAGHVRYLHEARSLGDALIVAVNTDQSVKTLEKAPDRPFNPQKERAEVLAGLESVDYVVLFAESTPEKLIRAIKPDFLVKGGDWKVAQIAGGPFVQSYGGKVKSLPFSKGLSTTNLVEKIRDARG